ncbi:MAG: type III-B CRISPR module RAMP protein Cmr6 [Desulfobacteraceae bacterium]|nr:type III-B CRISPR module RAMP protein Cmr6 [Desulfobacteraceae bacterium]
MCDIPLRREACGQLFDTALAPHPGLFLSRGIKQWPGDATQKGEAFQAHVAKAAGLAAPKIYQSAYDRWCRLVAANPTIAAWAGKLQGRMFIGLGGPSVIETGISLSRTYGVPLIPGSAQKGLTRAYAKAVGLDRNRTMEILFGRQGLAPDEMESGYVIFHDAWWIPGSAPTPLSPEIVTVHHHDYYKDGGASDATDFDSPVPNTQVSARGGFLFTVECADHAWAALARDLLAQALQQWGIGGKTAAGYGRFSPDDGALNKMRSAREESWPQAVIKHIPNKGEIEVSFENQKAVPIKMTKTDFEKKWPGLLKKISKKTTYVQATVKQDGNRIDLVSIDGKRLDSL